MIVLRQNWQQDYAGQISEVNQFRRRPLFGVAINGQNMVASMYVWTDNYLFELQDPGWSLHSGLNPAAPPGLED
jgi:hypothetical protein